MLNHKTITILLVLTLLGVAFCSTGFADEDIEFVPGEDSGFYYTIKKGDTLWDLSQKFYNSQWDWPGLWEINKDIKNPHWIYPGKRIRIFLKEKAALKPIVVEVQKVKKKVAPKKIKPSFSYAAMDHIGFLRKETHPTLGNIIRGEEGNLIMATNNIIYIKPSGTGTLVPGRLYHIFTTTPVKEKINGKEFTGVKHVIKAQAKVLEHKVSYVTAKIIDAYRPVTENDLIMEYYKRDSILDVDENPAPIDARIIASEDNNIMVNDNRIAFINLGEKDIIPGQIYAVARINEVNDHALWPKKKEKDKIKFDDLQLGKVIVLHTEDVASTVLILSSKYVISNNDIVK